jgi:hypothetical protein
MGKYQNITGRNSLHTRVPCDGQADANEMEKMDDGLIGPSGKNFSHLQVQNKDSALFFLNDERTNRISNNL